MRTALMLIPNVAARDGIGLAIVDAAELQTALDVIFGENILLER